MKTKHMFSSIACVGLLMAAPVAFSEELYAKGDYHKAVVNGGVLYMSDGYGFPSGYNASLTSVRLGESSSIQRIPVYTGIYNTTHPYPFRWDIVGDEFFSIAVTEYESSYFHLVRYRLAELNEIDRHRKKFSATPSNEPLLEYEFAHLRVLQNLGYWLGGYRGGGIFYDFLITPDHRFSLYALSQWERKIYLFPREGFVREDWKRDFPIYHTWKSHLTGPFYVMPQHGKTYLFSEKTGELYLIEKDQFHLIGALPQPIPDRETTRNNPTLIVDKDQDEFSFYLPETRQFFDPLAPEEQRLLAADSTERLSQLEQALRAALKEYGWLEE